MIEVFQRNH